NGPVKFASRTSKPALRASEVPASDVFSGLAASASERPTCSLRCAAARDKFLCEAAVGVCTDVVTGIARNRLRGPGGVRELNGTLDDGLENFVTEGLHEARDDFAAVQGAGVVHSGEAATPLRARIKTGLHFF